MNYLANLNRGGVLIWKGVPQIPLYTMHWATQVAHSYLYLPKKTSFLNKNFWNLPERTSLLPKEKSFYLSEKITNFLSRNIFYTCLKKPYFSTEKNFLYFRQKNNFPNNEFHILVRKKCKASKAKVRRLSITEISRSLGCSANLTLKFYVNEFMIILEIQLFRLNKIQHV